jgi:hypothetical protein
MTTTPKPPPCGAWTRPVADTQVGVKPDLAYGRRVLADAAVMIRDGQVGGPADGLSVEDATRVRAEIASWIDLIAKSLKNMRAS